MLMVFIACVLIRGN